MKTWSYKTITQKAESEIKKFMAKAESAKSDFDRWTYLNWAYGTFSYWNNLTMGWQNIGDSERLEALTKLEQKEAA